MTGSTIYNETVQYVLVLTHSLVRFVFTSNTGFIALGLYGSAVVINCGILLYAIHREIKTNERFEFWLIDNRSFSAIISFFSLANCEIFYVLGAGRGFRPRTKRTSNTGKPKTKFGRKQRTAVPNRSWRESAAPLFVAPISKDCEKILQRSSWVPLLFDDVGFSCIQAVRLRCF